MAEAKGGGESPTAGPDPAHVLRAKYLDFCSAQVAEILLRLSPDEMYVLAQEASRGRAGEGSVSYETLVQQATARIYERLNLPAFEAWVALYREDPDRYEADLIGLWQAELEPAPES